MNKMKSIFSGRKGAFYVECGAIVLSLAGLVYYLVQSNIDGCFHLLYAILTAAGIVLAIAHCLTRFDFLLPLAGAAIGAATGVMVYDMLPSMSDVWNGVTYIGGNLTAYVIYTVLSLLSAVALIVCCFAGTEKEVPAEAEA